MMTLRRLVELARRYRSAPDPQSKQRHLTALSNAVDLRIAERGRSKLARRLQRKHALGRAGAF